MIGYGFFYLLRVDLSIAIVCMVKAPSSGDLGNHSLSNQTDVWLSNETGSEGDCGELKQTEVSDEYVSVW